MSVFTGSFRTLESNLPRLNNLNAGVRKLGFKLSTEANWGSVLLGPSRVLHRDGSGVFTHWSAPPWAKSCSTPVLTVTSPSSRLWIHEWLDTFPKLSQRQGLGAYSFWRSDPRKPECGSEGSETEKEEKQDWVPHWVVTVAGVPLGPCGMCLRTVLQWTPLCTDHLLFWECCGGISSCAIGRQGCSLEVLSHSCSPDSRLDTSGG